MLIHILQARLRRSWVRASVARLPSSPTAASPVPPAASSSVSSLPLLPLAPPSTCKPTHRPSRRAHTGHVVPEAFVGGPIALVEDGDKIVIDTEKRSIDWLVDEEEQARRRAKWQQREYPEKRGVLFRYARDVAVSVFLVL